VPFFLKHSVVSYSSMVPNPSNSSNLEQLACQSSP